MNVNILDYNLPKPQKKSWWQPLSLLNETKAIFDKSLMHLVSVLTVLTALYIYCRIKSRKQTFARNAFWSEFLYIDSRLSLHEVNQRRYRGWPSYHWPLRFSYLSLPFLNDIFRENIQSWNLVQSFRYPLLTKN